MYARDAGARNGRRSNAQCRRVDNCTKCRSVDNSTKCRSVDNEQIVGAPTAALASTSCVPVEQKILIRLMKSSFHVKRIAFEREIIRMRGSFERSWHSNDVSL